MGNGLAHFSWPWQCYPSLMHTPGLCSLLGYKSTEEQIWIQASKSYLFWKNLTEGTIFTTVCTCRARVKKKCSSQASASQRNMHSSRERLEFFSFEPVCVSCPGLLRFVVSHPIVSLTGPAGELRMRQTYLLARDTAGGSPLSCCNCVFTCGAPSLAAALPCPGHEFFLLEILLDIILNAVTPPGMSIGNQKWNRSHWWTHLQHDGHWNSISDMVTDRNAER